MRNQIDRDDIRRLARERFNCPYCGSSIGEMCTSRPTGKNCESHSQRIALLNEGDADRGH